MLEFGDFFFVDTKKKQHMFSQGDFTRDELDHLLRLLNIMIFSMFHCSHSLSNRKQSAMSKRVQEGTSGEGSAVSKPRPMNLVARNFLSAKKTLRKIRVLRTARGIKSWIRVTHVSQTQEVMPLASRETSQSECLRVGFWCQCV